MTVLSAQSIRRLCQPPKSLIAPFVESGKVNGKSYGLSACTYDCRIDHDLILEPMPWNAIATALLCGPDDRDDYTTNYRALVSTVEYFSFPHNVCGSVLDKSTFARIFVSAFNTHLDPGWEGYLTVELVNFGDTIVKYKAGDPVCQVKFEWLDEPTELPYVGKYQRQERGPQKARYE